MSQVPVQQDANLETCEPLTNALKYASIMFYNMIGQCSWRCHYERLARKHSGQKLYYKGVREN